MCGFNQKLGGVNKQWKLSAGDLLGLYKIAEHLSRPFQPDWLYVYNGGSFLNPNEIPLQTQLGIFKEIRHHKTTGALFVESRPEFIQKNHLTLLRQALGHKLLEVGIGLEAVTDRVREVNIHKGFSRQDYERAVNLLRGFGIKVFTYVFLKPLGLTEKEAIEEAVRTITYAFEVGSDEVSLSCAFIQEGTVMERAYRQGIFQPPVLWSIIEVVCRTSHLGPIRIGSFEDNPPPIAIPKNCGKCDTTVLKSLAKYNLTRDISILHNLFCECKEKWSEDLQRNIQKDL